MWNSEKRFTLVIFSILFGIAFYFYIYYVFVRYEWNVPLEGPNSSYETIHPLCNAACNSIRAQRCNEWISLSNPNLCEYTCDTYLNKDELLKREDWNDIFSCADGSRTYSDLKDCQISCTVTNSL